MKGHAFERVEQPQIRRRREPRVIGAGDQGIALLLSPGALGWRSSCRPGRCPRPGDQRQDIGEHLSRHGDLGLPVKALARREQIAGR
jgi:hypothetical protein